MTDRRNGGEARDRDAGEPVKVLVTGSTGVAERLVRGMFDVVDGVELAYISRKKPNDGSERHFPLRIATGHNEICRAFHKRDWVVSCIGPLEVHTDSLARAYIGSGTGYININDSIDARRAIVALDGDTRRERIPILTGSGLCPDLSVVLLILGARAAGAEEIRNMRVDLRIGTDQGSGAASVESIFQTIRGRCRTMLGGTIVEVRRNPVSSQSGIGYECPDVDAIREVRPSIRGYSYHVAFDALPDRSVEKIRTSRLYAMPAVSGLLAHLGATVTSRKAQARDTPQPAGLVVALSSASAGNTGPSAETTVVQATGPGSYKMTAAITAATVVAAAGKPVAPGCRNLVDHPRLLEPILAFARDADIHIKVPHDNPTTGPLPTATHYDAKEREK